MLLEHPKKLQKRQKALLASTLTDVLKKEIKRANKNSLAVVLSETMEPIGHILNHYLGPEFIR